MTQPKQTHRWYKKMAAKKKPFGGYTIDFSKVADWPISKMFGKGKITPSEMTKLCWKFVKANKLSSK